MLELFTICSDLACADEELMHVGTLDDLDLRGCECGCSFVLLEVAEVELV